MTIYTHRPTRSLPRDSTITGAATAHGAVSDNSDSSWIATPAKVNGALLWRRPGDSGLTVPATGRIFAVRAVLRTSHGVVAFQWRRQVLSNGSVLGSAADSVTVPTGTSPANQATPWATHVASNLPWSRDLLSFPDNQGSPGGVRWEVDVAASQGGAGAGFRLYEVTWEVDHRAQPTVAITGPTGTITNTSRPVAQWSYSQADGMGQEAFRVRFLDGPLSLHHDSGWVESSATSYEPPDLPNGSYTVEVTVRAAWPLSGVLESDADTQAFTLNTPPAPTPTISSVPVDEANTAGRRVGRRLTVTRGAASPVTEFRSVEYRDPGDFSPEWRPLRWATLIDDDSAAITVDDWEAPVGHDREYRARAFYTDATSGNLISSSWSTVHTAQTPGSSHMLRDVLVGTVGDHMALSVAHGSEGRDRQGQLAQARGIGAARPTLGVGRFGGPVWTHTVQLFSEAEADRFDRLISQQRVLLLCWPSGKRAWVGIDQAEDEYVLNASDRFLRRVQMTYVEGDEPTEGLGSLAGHASGGESTGPVLS